MLRVGVCGLGVAFTHVAASLRRRSGIAFAAAADLRPAALDAFAREYGGRVYDDADALFRDPEIDVVYLATPNQQHARQAIAAAAHGKHVVVDKPLALSVAECEAMNRAAADAGVLLACGHLHSYGPAVRAMRRLVASGELGRLRMISTWHFNDWLYRPRAAWELAPGNGGNVVFNQGAHQVDIVRVLGGGLVRSVRGTTGAWDAARPIEGAYNAFLQFDDGASATLVYNGYAHFDTAELTSWIGEMPRSPEWNAGARRRLAAMTGGAPEEDAKESWRFGNASAADDGPETPHVLFGITIVSCERGDVRQTPTGLRVYRDGGVDDVPVDNDASYSGAALENVYDAIVHGAPLLRDGRWGEGTIEVLAALTESSRTNREISTSHQVATIDEPARDTPS